MVGIHSHNNIAMRYVVPKIPLLPHIVLHKEVRL